MKKKRSRKLNLAKNTVRKLVGEQLHKANGGLVPGGYTYFASCTQVYASIKCA